MKKTVTIKMKNSTHQQLKILCTLKNTSMQDFIYFLIEKYFNENNIKID